MLDIPAHYKPPKIDRQSVANAGLHYVAHRLSLLGWAVLPTSRNTKGVDLVVGKGDWAKIITVQVKSSSACHRIRFKSKPDHLASHYIVAANMDLGRKPRWFIFPRAEFAAFVKAEKAAGRFFVAPEDYAKDEYELVSRLDL
jgi:hypothetical protein